MLKLNKKQVYIIAIAVLAIAFVVELMFPNHHPYYWWHALPGFDLIFGFLGCSLLILVAKVILAPIIQKREDYYDDGGEHPDDE